MNIGDRIKEQRLLKGLTQKQLAEKLNVKQTAVSYWESGKREPDLDTIKKICAVLGITYMVIIGDALSNYAEEMSEDFKNEVATAGYYYNSDTAKKAQELFDDPNMKVLFDAARDARPEDLQKAADYLKAVKAMTLNLDNEGC